MNEQDAALFRKYAEIKNITLSELVRQTVMERIEDEFDLQVFEKAMAEHQENPITYGHDEVRQMLEL